MLSIYRHISHESFYLVFKLMPPTRGINLQTHFSCIILPCFLSETFIKMLSHMLFTVCSADTRSKPLISSRVTVLPALEKQARGGMSTPLSEPDLQKVEEMNTTFIFVHFYQPTTDFNWKIEISQLLQFL